MHVKTLNSPKSTARFPNRHQTQMRRCFVPRLETLEDRAVPSGTPPTVTSNLNDLIRGPNQEINLTVNVSDNDVATSLQWSAAFGTAAYLLDNQLAFANTSEYYYDFAGRQERWIQDGTGAWYFILANGELFRRTGTSGVTGQLLGTLDPIYYLKPSLLTDADNAGNIATNQQGLDMAWVLDTNLNFQDPNTVGGLYENSGGRGERWLLGTDLLGRAQWFFMLSNGELYQWDNVSAASGWLMAKLDPMYYQVEMLRELASTGGLPAPEAPNVTVAFNAASTTNYSNTLQITPTNYRGAIYVMAKISDGTGTGYSRIFSVTFRNTAPTLDNPGTVDVVSDGETEFNLDGSDVNPGDAAYLTYKIGFAQSFLGPTYLQLSSGSHLPALTYVSAWDNWGTQGSRWFQAANGNWYFMNQSGDFFEYNSGGSATGKYVGRLAGEYVASPILLQNDTNATPPAGASISVNDSGVVTVNMPSGFVGQSYAVIATLSDGLTTTARRFVISVE